MLKLLAFDYGASSGRAMLGGYDGKTLALSEVHRFSNDPVMINGTFYWDILRLHHEMKQGILKCAREGNGDLAGMGTDTWGVDFGLLGPSGELLGNPVHYRDERTEGMIEYAQSLVPAREIYEQTGNQFMKFNTLFQILAMVKNGSYMLEKAKELLFTPDLLNYFLTGEKICEYTIASTSQLYDSRSGKWALSMMDKMGIPSRIFLDITQPGKIIGRLSDTIASELGVGKLPVIAVTEHDTGCAVASVPVLEGRYAYISSGTWSLMGLELPQPVINDTAFELNCTNEGGICGTTRLIKNVMGLWIYQECKREWDRKGEAMSFDELEKLGAEQKPFGMFIDPDNDVFYGPGNMPEKITEFCRKTGQKTPASKGEMVRCVMESLALKYRMALEDLEKIAGYKIPVIHIVGGGSRNVMLNRFTANATGRPVVTGPVEATAAGNLIVQLMALGEIKDITQARMLVKRSFPVQEYEPGDVSAWDEAYDRFIKIVDK